MRLKCDGTRAETSFGLSAKRTSPLKSVGPSVQSIAGSRGVRISGSNAGYTKFRGTMKRCEGDWLLTPFASFPFTSHPLRHRVPSRFNWTLHPVSCPIGNGDIFLGIERSAPDVTRPIQCRFLKKNTIIRRLHGQLLTLTL